MVSCSSLLQAATAPVSYSMEKTLSSCIISCQLFRVSGVKLFLHTIYGVRDGREALFLSLVKRRLSYIGLLEQNWEYTPPPPGFPGFAA